MFEIVNVSLNFLFIFPHRTVKIKAYIMSLCICTMLFFVLSQLLFKIIAEKANYSLNRPTWAQLSVWWSKSSGIQAMHNASIIWSMWNTGNINKEAMKWQWPKKKKKKKVHPLFSCLKLRDEEGDCKCTHTHLMTLGLRLPHLWTLN